MIALRWSYTRTASTLSTYDERPVRVSDLSSSCHTITHLLTILKRSKRRLSWYSTSRVTSMGRSSSLQAQRHHQQRTIGKSSSRSGKGQRRLCCSGSVTKSYRLYSKISLSWYSRQVVAQWSLWPLVVRSELHHCTETWRLRIPVCSSDWTMQRRSLSIWSTQSLRTIKVSRTNLHSSHNHTWWALCEHQWWHLPCRARNRWVHQPSAASKKMVWVTHQIGQPRHSHHHSCSLLTTTQTPKRGLSAERASELVTCRSQRASWSSVPRSSMRRLIEMDWGWAHAVMKITLLSKTNQYVFILMC